MIECGDAEFRAAVIEALGPYLDRVVIVGGWAHRLFRSHPMAANVSYQPLLTKDTDIVLPPRVSFDEVDIKAVRNHAEAAAEIRAALIWYENERRGLGRTLWDQLQQAIYFIAEHPAIGSTVRRAKVYGTVRPQLLFLRKYPLPIWPRNLHRAFRGIELEKDGGSDLELVFIDRL